MCTLYGWAQTMAVLGVESYALAPCVLVPAPSVSSYMQSSGRFCPKLCQRARILPHHAHQQVKKGRSKGIGWAHEERFRIDDRPVEPIATINGEPGQEQSEGQHLPIQTSYYMDEPRGRQVGEDGRDEADANCRTVSNFDHPRLCHTPSFWRGSSWSALYGNHR